MLLKNKYGQVSAFVIVALVLVGVIVLFFAFKDSLFGQKIDAEFAQYMSCMSNAFHRRRLMVLSCFLLKEEG